jgi:hypothetical protein
MRRTGIISGRLNKVIIVCFICVCTAIADVKLNMIETARLESATVVRSILCSETGLSKNNVMNRYTTRVEMQMTIKLKMVLEMYKDNGCIIE